MGWEGRQKGRKEWKALITCPLPKLGTMAMPLAGESQVDN